MPWDSGKSKETVVNNFYWYVSEMVRADGASFTRHALRHAGGDDPASRCPPDICRNSSPSRCRTVAMRDIRREMYDKIVTLPIGFFTNERKGDIMARMSGDVQEVQTSVMASLFSIIKYPDHDCGLPVG